MWSPLLSLVQIKCGDDVFCSAMTIIFTLVTVSQILFPFFCWCLASCVLIEAYNRCMSRIRELWLSIYFIFFIYLLRVVSLSRKNAFFSHIALLSFFVGTIRSHTMVCSVPNFTNWQVAAWFCFFQIFVCLSPLECFSSTTISIWLAFATVILVELCMIIPLFKLLLLKDICKRKLLLYHRQSQQWLICHPTKLQCLYTRHEQILLLIYH